MLLRTTIPPRRDGTVLATVGDRRHTFAAGNDNDVLSCNVVPDADATELLAIPGERFVSCDEGNRGNPGGGATPAIEIPVARRRGRPPKVSA